MLRVCRRKCFHCSTVHERGIEARSFYSTGGPKKVEINCGGATTLEISSGRLARLADGTAVARLGNTAVMTTVVSKGKPSQQNFLPLTVDYRQKAAAAGRIPTNYLRRELGPSEREILVGRMIDRSVRPLFNKGYNVETGLTCNLLSVDGIHDPEVLSINAASAALSLSDVPWGPPVGAVRLGYLAGKIVVNPSRRELSHSELNLVVAGTKDGLTTMLEGEAKCLNHTTFLDAIELGLHHCARIAEGIDSMAREMGKTKRDSLTAAAGVKTEGDSEMKILVDTLCSANLRCIYTDYSLDKQSRDAKMFKVRDDMINHVRSLNPGADAGILGEMFSSLSKLIIRNLIFQENIRVDGRSSTDIRPISCEVNLHTPLHGSALFQRGQTQVLCTVALDSLQSAMKLDPITAITGGVKEKNFLLHYEFPGFATGELGRGGSRRELGHGALAEKALRQVLPNNTQFTIRLTSEVLESNGSSSMASICGGSMALLDAGIPLSELCSGVAMGLVTREDGEHRVLTDIMGMEDFLGDMDFKFSCTRSGVCALQADVKLPGISLAVIRQAVDQGVQANHIILDIMARCIQVPRDHKDCWPVSSKLEVPPHKRGKFIGQAGLNLRRITQDTGVQIYSEAEGVWQLFAPNPESMAEAETRIEELLTEEKVPELEFGAIYTGRITEILDRGVMIQLHEQMSPVLLHNSQLSARKIQHPSALDLKVGQDLQVKYYGRDPATGQMRLSRKALAVSSAAAVKNLQNSTKRKDGETPPTKSGDGGETGFGGGGTPPPVFNEVLEDTVPSLCINENKADVYASHLDPRDYLRMQEKRKTVISMEDLFVKKTVKKVILPSEPSEEPGVLAVSAEAGDGEEDSQDAYYEIDRLFNKLMALNVEIKEATQRKENVEREWGFIKENLASIAKNSHISSRLPKVFNRDSIQLCKKFSAQSKAINETLLLLTRQYKDIKEELERAKLSFFKAKNPSVPRAVLEEAIQDPGLPDHAPVEVVLQVGGQEEDLDPERFNREVIEELVQEALVESRLLNTRGISVQRSGHPDTKRVEEKSLVSTLFPEPAAADPTPASQSRELVGRRTPELTPASQSQELVGRRRKLKENLESLQVVEEGRRFPQLERKNAGGSFQNISAAHKFRVRNDRIENMKTEMRNINERLESGEGVPETIRNQKVSRFVKKNTEDFFTLLRWFEEREAKQKDILEGIETIHSNTLLNLKELDNNLKYLRYHRSGVEFIGRHLGRPDHPLVGLALRNVNKLESIYQQKLDFLSKDASIHTRQEQHPAQVWDEFHRVRVQLNQIRRRLWEVELSEERLADLDDWREEQEEGGHNPAFLGIQEQIDRAQQKIDGFTRQDMEKNWATVEKDLHKLQGLKIAGLISWLTKSQSLPPWLSPELKDNLLDRCYRYAELDQKRNDILNSWMNLGKKDESLDLSLDVLYSQIRSCMAKVKYSCMENSRHKSELGIYRSWMDNYGARLREQSRCQLQDMLKLAEERASEVDEALRMYVGVISSNQDNARNAATILDKMREEKREVVRQTVDAILHACREVNYQGVDILSYDQTL